MIRRDLSTLGRNGRTGFGYKAGALRDVLAPIVAEHHDEIFDELVQTRATLIYASSMLRLEAAA